MEAKTKLDYKEHKDYGMQKCGESTDCTGLIPSLPQSDDEVEAYNEMYAFLPRASSCAK